MIRNFIISTIGMVAVTILSWILSISDGKDTFVPMLFILAVFLISRYTEGYLSGIICSFVGVVLVNYIFTYPYFHINFSISGYPITFIAMLLTSAMTSAMTTQIMQQEKLRMEAEKEKLRGNLLRAVSHDLRTPLTTIVGTTQALLDNEGRISPQKQRELLRESHDNAEWLIRMVENLLSITRMNSSQAKIIKSSEAAEEIVSEAVTKFKKRFPESEVQVQVPQELLIVPMDAILIEQVLINLMENAVLHGKREKEILVTLQQEGDAAVFMVKDYGVGISIEAMQHLFQGDFAGDREEADHKKNMGIGLSVCLSIVKAHGGEMSGKNAAEGGAEFSFYLPLSTEHEGK